MHFEPHTVTLKDGRTAVLRAPRTEDAQGLLDYMNAACRETDFLLRSAEEAAAMTLEGEERWVQASADDPDCYMLICEVDGKLAGNCEIRFNHRTKTRHLASVGIGIRQEYWGLGIGTAMFRLLLAEAQRRKADGVRFVQLEFIEGNSRARGLYEKMGFRIVGMCPNAFTLRDGSLAAEYIMQYEL